MTTRKAVPNFETHIRPLFRDEDVEAMSYWADLSEYSDVKKYAKEIYERVAAGSMPCDGRWDQARVDLFHEWMDTGMLERDPGPSIQEITRRLTSVDKRSDSDPVADLKEGLQCALELELATMPLYMTAYWSIRDASSAVAMSVREIFKDEMWHLANVCNILAGLGGTPAFVARCPKFPGPLPAGVHPRLVFALDRLSHATVRSFMELEHPDIDIVNGVESPESKTVGAFYEAIAVALQRIGGGLDTTRQLSMKVGPEGEMRVYGTATEAAGAIRAIASEGEGTKGGPTDPAEQDLAHFYQFGEIYYGKKLVAPTGGESWTYTGADLPFPETYPVAEVPAGGWGRSDVDVATATLLDEFDQKWTTLLTNLEKTWAGPTPDDAAYKVALTAMRRLSGPATQIVKTPMPNGRGNCAPCFRLVRLSPPPVA